MTKFSQTDRVSTMRYGAVLALLFLLGGCANAIQDAYFNMWEKIGVEKRDILVDRVEAARETQQEAQQQFSSALEEFSALINFDGGELETVYNDLNERYEDSSAAAQDVSERINKVESVASSLFREWEQELTQISNANLRRDSKNKLEETQRRYTGLVRSMRRAEESMQPVLTTLRDNVLYLKHNLNANAIGALQGELQTIQRDVKALTERMNAAIKESDDFIASIQGA